MQILSKLSIVCASAFSAVLNTAFSATSIPPQTNIQLVYPSPFDSEQCNQTAFSGTLASLASPRVPVDLAQAHIEEESVGGRPILIIELIQRGGITASVQIQAQRATLNTLEEKLGHGEPLNLTEFAACGRSDGNLVVVEQVGFMPLLKALAPRLDAKIEYIKRNDAGVCTVINSKSLADMIRYSNPGIELEKVEGQVEVFARGRSTSDGRLVSREIDITFHQHGLIDTILDHPRIRIWLPSELSYSAINALQMSGGVLRMTSDPSCKGERADSPVWIYNIAVQ